MKNKNKFYITTPIYYANASPHIGSAYTTVAADALARFHRLQGKEVFFLTGTDEHGEKIAQAARKQGIAPQEYVDQISSQFKQTWQELNISYNNFIRTTAPAHKKAVQKALQYLYDKGYIYKGKYQGLYCLGCEQYKTAKELVDGLCPDHKTKPIVMEEESYLFRLSAFSETIKEKIKNDELKIRPQNRQKEVLSFLEEGLKDISFSRKIEWGVPLPWDKSQTAYVWADAFLNYLTGLGWEGETQKTPKFWPADLHLMSKDILRVHATIWPAMLLALGLPLPKEIFVHGFFLVEGQKMSKSLGNVITPSSLIDRYEVDGTRYLLLSATPFGHDGDISIAKFDEKYNADLANGLGNLVSRALALVEKTQKQKINLAKTKGVLEKRGGKTFKHNLKEFWEEYSSSWEELAIDKALEVIFKNIRFLDDYITTTKPWELIKANSPQAGKILYNVLERIAHLSLMLWPFMPETAEKIWNNFNHQSISRYAPNNFPPQWGIISPQKKYTKGDILFPRLK